MRHRLKAITAFGLLALWFNPAAIATVVTISASDFQQGGVFTENVTVKGFRFSPNCHYDVLNPNIGEPAFIGMDVAGSCYDPDHGINNPDFLGPDEFRAPGNYGLAAMYIDAGGHPFSLLGMDLYAFWSSDYTITSSKDGAFHGSPPPGDPNNHTATTSAIFDGPEWRGIDWLLWTGMGGGAPCCGILSMTVRVPEPGTLALLGLGLASLGFSRRRKPR